MNTDIEYNKSDQEEDSVHSIETMETRWKYAVFPAMVAFVILGAFGFYLIYGMLQRMEDLAEDIDDMSKVMIESLPIMEGGVVGMSSRMQWVGEDLKGMREDVNKLSLTIQQTMPAIEGKLEGMSANVSEMSYATLSMANTTQNMSQNLWNMNRNFSKPLSVMRKIMPWSGDNIPQPAPIAPLVFESNIAQPQSATTNVQEPSATVSVQNKATVTLDPSIDKGKQKYINLCASCHGTTAEGGVGPSLLNHNAKLIKMIFEQYRLGQRSGTMTGLVKTFTEDDIANVSSFLEYYGVNASKEDSFKAGK